MRDVTVATPATPAAAATPMPATTLVCISGGSNSHSPHFVARDVLAVKQLDLLVILWYFGILARILAVLAATRHVEVVETRQYLKKTDAYLLLFLKVSLVCRKSDASDDQN